VTGYKAYDDVGTIEFYSENSAGLCNANITNNDAIADQIRSLIAIFKAAVLDDFAPGRQRISPLPNLLYPCSPRTQIRVPWKHIAWDCFTAASAIFSPCFGIVIWILQIGTPDPENQAEGAPNATWKRQIGDAEPIRDEDAQTSFLLPRKAQ
jgi:hypothetical protein